MFEGIPRSVLAGLALALHFLVPDLAERMGSEADILERIGAGRSQAFEMRRRLLELLPSLFGRAGRPARPPAEEESLFPILEACFDYVAHHPGAVSTGKKRCHYSDGYRRFVVELAGPGGLAEGLSLADLSRASRVPKGTLQNWLCPPPGRGQPGPAPKDAEDLEGEPHHETSDGPEQGPNAKVSETVRDVHLRQLLALWEGWRGTFVDFCRVVHDYRLPYSASFIADALHAAGLRFRKPRSSGQAPWTHETFCTYFPGAQSIGDGTTIVVRFLKRMFVFNVEALIDGASNALVGLCVSDSEDEEAVRKAYEVGIETTGSPPIAVALDNRPSNHSSGAVEALSGSLVLRSSPGRPESKAPVEGAFGLFRQAVPPLHLEGETQQSPAASWKRS